MRSVFFTILLLLSFKANAQYNISYYAYGSPLDFLGSFNAKPLNIYPTSGSNFFFYMRDSIHGVELWKGDGVTAPTMVADLNPTKDILEWNLKTEVGAMCSINGVLYFSVTDAAHGAELWKYDGTNPPSLVADVVPGIAGSAPCYMQTMGGKLYFGAFKDSVDAVTYPSSRNMFVYNPATNTVSPVIARSNQIKLRYRMYVEGTKFIYVSGNTSDSLRIYSYEPSTGTEALYITPMAGQTILPRNLYKWNGKYYFTATDATYGYELYEAPASGGNAVRITDINPGTGSSIDPTCNAYGEPRYVGFGNYLYFFAQPSTSSPEAYKYDPATGNVSLQNYNVGIGYYGGIAYNNKLLFGGMQPNTRTATYNVAEPCVFNGVDSPKVIRNLSTSQNGTYPLGWVMSADSTKILFAAGGDDYANNPKKIFTLTDSTFVKDTSTGTSVQTVRQVVEAKAYPNPVKEVLNIEVKVPQSMALQVQLVDNAGRVLYNNNLKKYNRGIVTINVNMVGYAAGIYYYRITDETGKTVSMGRVLH
ncbi:MAG: T9SS type A sorting domain-containing protein [Flavipsychrobacter sp.]